MKLKFVPLIAVLVLTGIAHPAEAQQTRTFFGVAKVNLPKGIHVRAYSDDFTKDAYVLSFSKDAVQGSNMWTSESPVMFIQKKTLSKSEQRWSNTEWTKRMENYYKSVLSDSKQFKRNSMTKDGRKGVFTVDYQSVMGDSRYRDFTKYIRADKGTQVQAFFSTSKPNTWNNSEPKALRKAVESLRASK
jgi:hypothetical protein